MSDTDCLSCSVGYYLSVNTCLTTCPNGFFGKTTTNTCEACNIACDVCITSAVDCISCKNGYFLTGNTCVTNCLTGFFGNTTTKTCEACHSSCSTCINSATNCSSISCPMGFWDS